MMKLVLAIFLLSLCFSSRRAAASFSGDPDQSQSEERALDSDSRSFRTLAELREAIQSELSDGHLKTFDGHLTTSDEEFDLHFGRFITSDSEPCSHLRQPGSLRGRLVTSDLVQLESAGAGHFLTLNSELRARPCQLDASWVNTIPSNLDLSAQNWDTDADDTPAIWITLAQRGLDYLKDVLLTQVLETITPLSLPSIRKTASIPIVGDVTASFTNVTLVHAEVPSSTIALGETGVAMQGFNGAANLTLNWQYTYQNIWLPGPVSDAGGADIKVVGMQAGVSVNVQEYMGTLNLSVLQCGTYIDKLDVQLKGESSWLYQWMVNGLEERMRTTIEEQLSGQIQEGVQNLNSYLLDTPQQVQVDDMSELNFTIVSEPIVSPTSLSIGVKGKFNGRRVTEPDFKHIPRLPPGLVCIGNTKMATIALSESVFKDGAAIYYNADMLNWLIDKVPEQTFLNTSKWKFLIPELYQHYPNEEIKLSFEVSAPPDITLTLDGVDVSAAAHMNIGVVNNDTIVQVACISITASASGLAGLNENNITGQVTLKDLSLDLEWSNVGKIHLALVKVFVKTLVKDALLPFLNLSLKRGFPLPMLPAMKLKDSTVNYGNGFLLVCTDVQYVKNIQ